MLSVKREMSLKNIKRELSLKSLKRELSSLKRDKPGVTLKTEDASIELKFEGFYELKSKLSKGSFGIVYLSHHIATGREYAVKVIERKELNEKEKSSVEREVSILKDLKDVAHVVQLVDFYCSPERYYVVQQFAEGGDVFERLAQRTSYTEKDARDLAVCLLEAIDGLHSRKLAHRDLKPENLLLRDMFDDTSILVADFGFASYVPEEGLKTRCGTPAFVAPQILTPNCRYDERVDMWSVGCLLYMLIAGYPPFQDRNHRGLFRKVRGADFVFHDMYWKNVSIAAKQLISSLLTVNPDYRCTARKALEDAPWLKMDASLLKAHDLAASLGEIKKFHARRTLKGAIHAVLWSNKFKSKSADHAEFSRDMKPFDGEFDSKNSSAVLGSDEHTEDDQPAKRLDASDSILVTKLRATLTFEDVYEVKELLHSGQTAKVYECCHRRTKNVYAVKIVERSEKSKKSVLGRTLAETVLHEVAVLDSLKHKNIIRIKDFFEDDDRFYLVMERMRGGDVFDRIMKQTKYPESDARKLAKALLEAVAYFHEQGIAHRDLKPQNLLLKSEDDPADIKITDFGFACRCHTPQSLTTRCGTPSYVAPEVLKNIPYDQSSDMWSVGVILYVLLCGCPPFVDENQSELFRKIRTADWKFVGEEWKDVSKDARNLIRKLLVANPAQRATAKEALTSKWFTKDNDSTPEKRRSFTKRKSGLGSFASNNDWKNSDKAGGLKLTDRMLNEGGSPRAVTVKATVDRPAKNLSHGNGEEDNSQTTFSTSKGAEKARIEDIALAGNNSNDRVQNIPLPHEDPTNDGVGSVNNSTNDVATRLTKQGIETSKSQEGSKDTTNPDSAGNNGSEEHSNQRLKTKLSKKQKESEETSNASALAIVPSQPEVETSGSRGGLRYDKKPSKHSDVFEQSSSAENNDPEVQPNQRQKNKLLNKQIESDRISHASDAAIVPAQKRIEIPVSRGGPNNTKNASKDAESVENNGSETQSTRRKLRKKVMESEVTNHASDAAIVLAKQGIETSGSIEGSKYTTNVSKHFDSSQNHSSETQSNQIQKIELPKNQIESDVTKYASDAAIVLGKGMETSASQEGSNYATNSSNCSYSAGNYDSEKQSNQRLKAKLPAKQIDNEVKSNASDVAIVPSNEEMDALRSKEASKNASNSSKHSDSAKSNGAETQSTQSSKTKLSMHQIEFDIKDVCEGITEEKPLYDLRRIGEIDETRNSQLGTGSGRNISINKAIGDSNVAYAIKSSKHDEATVGHIQNAAIGPSRLSSSKVPGQLGKISPRPVHNKISTDIGLGNLNLPVNNNTQSGPNPTGNTDVKLLVKQLEDVNKSTRERRVSDATKVPNEIIKKKKSKKEKDTSSSSPQKVSNKVNRTEEKKGKFHLFKMLRRSKGRESAMEDDQTRLEI